MKTTDLEAPRILTDSGAVKDERKLVSFFYELLRDFLPAGKVEELVTRALQDKGPAVFCNGWLAQYAQYCVDRLSQKETK